jgi:hypothetical protein
MKRSWRQKLLPGLRTTRQPRCWQTRHWSEWGTYLVSTYQIYGCHPFLCKYIWVFHLISRP